MVLLNFTKATLIRELAQASYLRNTPGLLSQTSSARPRMRVKEEVKSSFPEFEKESSVQTSAPGPCL